MLAVKLVIIEMNCVLLFQKYTIDMFWWPRQFKDIKDIKFIYFILSTLCFEFYFANINENGFPVPNVKV